MTTTEIATSDDLVEPLARRATALAMATLVVSSFGWNVLVPSGPRLPLALLGAVFLLASTLGWIACERRGRRAIGAWLTLLAILALASLWVSHLAAFLVVMPVIGLAVMYGSTRWGILLTAVFLGFAALVAAHLGAGPVQIYASSTGFLPGAVFTIVFAQLIVSERRARQQVRRYAAQVEELATTRERNRIAREIHDSVGHYLTVVHVQLEAARAIVGAQPSAAEECLARAQELAREGLQELRRSVTLLRSVDQRPFRVALAGLVEDCRGQGLDTTLEVDGEPRPLTPALEFTLYRAAQEALTNVTRHANARHARCTLRYAEREVRLHVEDDGVGAVAAEGGFGLVGLRERVQLVGGTVEIRTSPGQGFHVEVRVPT